MRFKAWRDAAEELRRTTLDPATRRLLRVTVSDGPETDRILTELMGKDVEARFKFIMRMRHGRISICSVPLKTGR